jgi:hypothetical protein
MKARLEAALKQAIATSTYVIPGKLIITDLHIVTAIGIPALRKLTHNQNSTVSYKLTN